MHFDKRKLLLLQKFLQSIFTVDFYYFWSQIPSGIFVKGYFSERSGLLLEHIQPSGPCVFPWNIFQERFSFSPAMFDEEKVTF